MLYRPTGVFANLYEHDVTDEDCATLLSWAVTVLEQVQTIDLRFIKPQTAS